MYKGAWRCLPAYKSVSIAGYVSCGLLAQQNQFIAGTDNGDLGNGITQCEVVANDRRL